MHANDANVMSELAGRKCEPSNDCFEELYFVADASIITTVVFPHALTFPSNVLGHQRLLPDKLL